MINAQYARRLADEENYQLADEVLEQLSDRIEVQASLKGHDLLVLDYGTLVENLSQPLRNFIVDRLTEKGFKVRSVNNFGGTASLSVSW